LPSRSTKRKDAIGDRSEHGSKHGSGFDGVAHEDGLDIRYGALKMVIVVEFGLKVLLDLGWPLL